MKNKIGDVVSVHLEFTKAGSWLKYRSKKKDLKCENCGKPHSEEQFVAFAAVRGRLNAHLCRSCGEYFISNGAEDVMVKRASIEERRKRLVVQATRNGIEFASKHARHGRSEDSYSYKELRGYVAMVIKKDRADFKSFLTSPYKDKIEDVCNELNSEDPLWKYTPFGLFKDSYDIFCNYNSDDNYDHHRWCSYFDATKKIGNKIYSYCWANANGDNSLEDAGFIPNDVWKNLEEVDPPASVDVSDLPDDALEAIKLLESRGLKVTLVKKG